MKTSINCGLIFLSTALMLSQSGSLRLKSPGLKTKAAEDAAVRMAQPQRGR